MLKISAQYKAKAIEILGNESRHEQIAELLRGYFQRFYEGDLTGLKANVRNNATYVQMMQWPGTPRQQGQIEQAFCNNCLIQLMDINTAIDFIEKLKKIDGSILYSEEMDRNLLNVAAVIQVLGPLAGEFHVSPERRDSQGRRIYHATKIRLCGTLLGIPDPQHAWVGAQERLRLLEQLKPIIEDDYVPIMAELVQYLRWGHEGKPLSEDIGEQIVQLLKHH